MEVIATALGVEVAKVQASTMQERVRVFKSSRFQEFGYGAFQVIGRLDDGVRKLLSFFASFKRTVVQIVGSF